MNRAALIDAIKGLIIDWEEISDRISTPPDADEAYRRCIDDLKGILPPEDECS